MKLFTVPFLVCLFGSSVNRIVSGSSYDKTYLETSIFRLLQNLQNSLKDCSWKVLLQKRSILLENGILDKLLDQKQSNTIMEIYNFENLKSIWTITGESEQKYSAGCRCRLVLSSMESLTFPFSKKEIKTFSLRPDEDYYIFLTDSPEKEAAIARTFVAGLKYQLIIYNILEDNKQNFKKCKMKGISLPPFASETQSVLHVNLDRLCSNKLEERVDWKEIFFDFTKNMHGHVMKISVPTKIKGFFEISRHKDGSWYAARGKEKFLLESVMDRLNFTTHLFQSTGLGNDQSTAGGSGVKLPNGSWTGCVGDIVSDRAHFSTTCAPSLSRFPVTDFTRHVGHGWLIFVMGRPTHIFSWTVIFKAFQLDFWIALTGVCTFVVFYMHFLTKFSVYFRGMYNISSGIFYNSVWSLKTTAHNIFATLLGQEVSKPKSDPSRVFYIFWLFFALVVSTIYVSKLVGHLTFPEIGKVPHNFHDLTNSEYKTGMHGASRGGMGEAHLKSSFPKLFQKLDLDPGDYNCLANGLVSKYACLIYKQTADYMIQKDFISSNGQHGFIYSLDSTMYVSTSWMMKKRALHKQSFNDVIKWTYDSGLLDKWEQLDYAYLRKARLTNSEPLLSKNITAPTKNSVPAPLSLNNFTASFVILFIGNTVALITFFVERIHKYMNTILGLF